MDASNVFSLSAFLPLDPSLKALREHDAEVAPLISCFAEKNDILQASSQKKSVAHRRTLTEALLRQYESVPGNEHAIKQIERLLNPDVFTVTTGHQICFAGGPLYVIIKVAQTIALARKLEKEAGLQVVPVLWMATEDHDLTEISEFTLYGNPLPIPEQASANKAPVGRLDAAVFSELVQAFSHPDMRHDANMVELVQKCYRPGNTLAAAFRELMHALFGIHGLVVIDADDAALKNLFLPFMQRELTESMTLAAVNHTISSEAYAGLFGEGQVQAKPREINLFYIEDNQRLKIEKAADGFVTENGKEISYEQMHETLQQHPEKFSPGVLLRPLYQECILPNLAYTGGAAEIKYWMQLRQLFTVAGIHMPALVLRNSYFFIEKNHWEKWKGNGFSEKDIFLSPEQLSRKLAEKAVGGFSMDAYVQKTEALFHELLQEIQKIDPTLSGATEAEKVKQLAGLRNLEGRAIKAAKQKEEVSIKQVLKTKEGLFPGGAYRERSEPGILRWFDARSDISGLLMQTAPAFGFEGFLAVL